MCRQLLKAWGAHVTVTCSQNAEGLVRGLGADEVVDYTAGDSLELLEMMEKYVSLVGFNQTVNAVSFLFLLKTSERRMCSLLFLRLLIR